MICTGIALSIDISRHYNPKIQALVDKLFSDIMRKDEVSGSFALSGVSYMFLGFFISVVLFSKGIAISSLLVLIVSDTAAAIIGKKAGTNYSYGKSMEGAFAFVISSFLIGVLSYTFASYNATFISIIIASFITTYVEYNSNKWKINDNLAIPITYGMTITILGWFA
jgi:dolichol kinase